ncbi:expressed unknown protein [Seminavis robusta]|uniref:Uncharacterized protein n=1 Tax=Seminavis robusta TaxID=568900 RepID=A0A9N8EVE9_9STRA|nr:expressed unknown protein [Seminavis robusta]|eukprot:Sro1804_g298660.1 n/a (178) ;mRNA; f:5170-5703
MCFPTDFMVAAQVRTTTNSSNATGKKARFVHKKKTVIKRSISGAKKSVRFVERTTIAYRHMPRSDMQHAWNQAADISNIKTGIRESMMAFHQVNGQLHELDSATHCFRGIESGISPAIYKLRKLWVKTVHQNVLDEQRIQKASGIVDLQKLGDVARSSSQESVRCAAAMGALDAKQA